MSTKRYNLDHITREHFADIDPVYINSGMCCDWAWTVKKQYTEAQLFEWVAGDKTHAWGHAFVKLADLYYDSESPTGVRDWRELGFIRRLPEDGDCVTHGRFSSIPVKRFRREWGISHRNLMKKLEKYVGKEEK
jgi:hypothetical protein